MDKISEICTQPKVTVIMPAYNAAQFIEAAIRSVMAQTVNDWELLVIDDMKFAVPMAKNAACPIAFAGWGRKEFPTVCREMEDLCDYAFYSPDELEKFLFD